MRKIVILALALALGGVLLWHFELRRIERVEEDDSGPTGVPTFIERRDPAPAGPGTEADDEASAAALGLKKGEVFIQGGPVDFFDPYTTPDSVRRVLSAKDSVPLNARGTRVEYLEITAQVFERTKSVPPQDVLRTQIVASSAEVDLTGKEVGLGSIQRFAELELVGVSMTQYRGTPLAELTLSAPRASVRLEDEELRSVEKDEVKFVSRDIRGRGRGLVANMQDGEVRFEDGADMRVELGQGRIATIRTPEGGPLHIVELTPLEERETGAPRRIRIRALNGVHAEIRPDETVRRGEAGGLGSEPIRLDARTLDVVLEIVGDDQRPRVIRARADDQVVIDRGLDTYYGDTALFTFDEANEPTSVVLEDQPRLTYRAVDPDGRELELEISGAGPLTANFIGTEEQKEDERRGLQVEFRGPGRIESVRRATSITFTEGVTAAGLEDRSRAELRIVGDVDIQAPEGTVAAEVIDATLRPGDELRVVTAGTTRLTRRDLAEDLDYRMVAAQGLTARLADEAWFVERADRTVIESLGPEPFRIEADRIEDVDIEARTLRASENIVYRTVWGAARAPVALVREAETIELVGTADAPVQLDFFPEDPDLELEAARRMSVRTGWLHAPKLVVTREAIYAYESVAAQVETRDGVFSLDAATLTMEREVTGLAFDGPEGQPIPAGHFRARPAEELHMVARGVREARYGAPAADFVFSAETLDLLAPLEEQAEDGQAGLADARETRIALDGEVTITGEVFAEDADVTAPREPIQTMEMRAASAVLTRSSGDLVTGESPYSLQAREVERCVFDGQGRHFEVVADEIDVDGEFGEPARSPSAPKDKVDLTGTSLVARGDVDLVFQPAPDEAILRVRGGQTLVLVDGKRGSFTTDVGKRIIADGTMPGDGVPYRLTASELDFQREELQARGDVELEFMNPVRTKSSIPIKRVRAHLMNASETEILLLSKSEDELLEIELEDGSTRLRTTEIAIDPQQIKEAEESRRSVRPQEPVPTAPRQNDGQDEPVVRMPGHIVEIDGPGGFALRLMDPSPPGKQTVYNQMTVELPGDPIDMDLFGVVIDQGWLFDDLEEQDFLLNAERGTIRGEATPGRPAWSFDFAAIEMKPVGDEIMLTIVAPRIIVGNDTARADYLAVWLDRARWRARMANLLRGEDMPETFPGDSDEEGANRAKPNFLAELLFQVQSEEYGRYARALYMEGGVEIAREDKRAAKGTRLYLGLADGEAWLENAELVYPLMSDGEEVPLRVRTERLATDETGRLVANGATLTTCDHEVPHFVVRTGEFALEPRDDDRWRFSATGNRLRFQGGWQLPLPSIGNVVLDEDFGVVGIENEAGEVTPLRDIGFANTARFGTVLGTAFRFDIGDFGSWIGERIGMNTDRVTGKWNTEAQWLGSRGPLLGFGLELREREPGDEKDEEFRFDSFITGIPDTGRDRGTVRVPEDERDRLRLFGWVRSRYPIVRGEWIDFAFASQTDAGVQPEFLEREFLNFEQRDTFIRWRKSFGADYLTGGAQKRVDDFRSQKEELPSFLAYRGERAFGRFAGAPLLWGGNFEVGYFTRREGEVLRDLFSDLPGGAVRGVGNFETGRADLSQRLSLPMDTELAGIKVTPFADARGTAWTSSLDEGADDPSRAYVRTGVEMSTTLHKVTDNGYLSALAPRLAASTDPFFEENGGGTIPLDQVEVLEQDGTVFEAGLRAVWDRPETFENLDVDLRALVRQDRMNGLPDTTQAGILAEYITRYGDGEGQIGFRHDARYDLEASITDYSRSALAWRPSDVFLSELRYSQARAIDQSELFETAALVLRARVDPKWELEGTYVRDLQNDEHLLTEVVLRRFSHDFVFDITFQDRAGEGGTNISFSLLPLLGWTRNRLGMLDRR